MDISESIANTIDSEYYRRMLINSCNMQLGLDIAKFNDVMLWCNEQFGQYNYINVGSLFCFKDEKDLVLFKLRWL